MDETHNLINSLKKLVTDLYCAKKRLESPAMYAQRTAHIMLEGGHNGPLLSISAYHQDGIDA
jgi:hypothetical protein